MNISVNSVPCGTELLKISKLKPLVVINFTTKDPEVFRAPQQSGHIHLSGKPHPHIPYTSFITQSLSDWLKCFINAPQTENQIEEWKSSLSSKCSSKMWDVFQAKSWNRIMGTNRPQTNLNLVFSLFFNWFNPKGNQISRKQVSMGIIPLNFLNLPPMAQSYRIT
ncbi:hypothetical protein O181_086617 [Austropuccinia psidii MF-1]|uniref:Uncharacterized protein n=1 Tax=Austropuccinia psidii MF-1 TaxID=1389203 RepID=A0A9Q3G005_9BASI|nr:hypothetical protein [Austropuccinia psidii MF-1]